jgi:hypothetical protein
MRFLVFGDIVENKKALEKFSKLDFTDYDFVLFTGDTLTLLPFKKLREKRVLAGEISENEEERKRHLKETVEDKKILQKEVLKLKGLVKYFSKINEKIPIYGIWGNADHLWVTSQTTIFKYIKNFHLKSIKINGINFIGYNGRPKYIFETYENPTERAFDENKAFKELSEVFEKTKGKIIFVTHAPPYEILDRVEEKYRKYAVGTYGKKAKEGHIGSIAFRKIDNKFKPVLHVFGHIHECKGFKKINKTTFVNSGSFGKGLEYTEIEIKNNKIKVNFLK